MVPAPRGLVTANSRPVGSLGSPLSKVGRKAAAFLARRPERSHENGDASWSAVARGNGLGGRRGDGVPNDAQSGGVGGPRQSTTGGRRARAFPGFHANGG